MRPTSISLLILLQCLVSPSLVECRVYNIKDYGARTDQEDCTEAIRNTLEAAALDEKNGGAEVLIPKGNFITAPINITSNIKYHITYQWSFKSYKRLIEISPGCIATKLWI